MSATRLQLFAPPRVVAEPREDGTVLLRSTDPLGEHAPSMAHVFRRLAAEHPDRVLAAQRTGDEWVELTWGDAAECANRIAQALLARGLGPDRPLMVLSGNSLEHLQLTLGCFDAGVPILPISTAYSLMSKDHNRIRRIAELCSPGMVFADDAGPYGSALEALRGNVAIQCVARGEFGGAISFPELVDTEPGEPVEITPDTVAKVLFTSGSTGAPKGVINTHRMLCSNQQALGQIWPFLENEPPTLVDWLPWSHTFGGNHNVGQVIAFGGTLFIDDGRPAPPLFDRSVNAIAHARPTVYYNVPAGYALLTPRLEQDRDFAEAFFSRLRFMFYAAAALPPDLWDRLRAVADDVADHDVPLTASWGCTETAPAATSAHFADSACGCIGVPIPGVAIKLVPHGDKQEIRVLGPNVTPGYHRNEEATTAAFDEEGFYRTGDAVQLVDPDDPNRGLMFDGRLAEDFKLITGTWVHVGKLRTALVSAAQVLNDAVICGHDRECVAALAWLNTVEAARVTGSDDIDDPALRAHLARCLAHLNEGAGSARRIERLLLLAKPPDIDAGEITDKGYLNQRTVRERRADAVERLYSEPLPDDVIVPA
jgi:feruloyl-CoA synthase